MELIRFIDIVQSYGAQPSRWPENERKAALTFADKFEDAQILLSEARALDRALSRVKAAPPSQDLQAKIMSGVQAPAEPLTAIAANDRLPYRTIAASLIAGVMIGLWGGFGYQNDQDVQSYDYAQTETVIDSNVEMDYGWMSETFDDGKL